MMFCGTALLGSVLAGCQCQPSSTGIGCPRPLLLPALPWPNAGIVPASVTIADFNRDGRPDLADARLPMITSLPSLPRCNSGHTMVLIYDHYEDRSHLRAEATAFRISRTCRLGRADRRHATQSTGRVLERC